MSPSRLTSWWARTVQARFAALPGFAQRVILAFVFAVIIVAGHGSWRSPRVLLAGLGVWCFMVAGWEWWVRRENRHD